MAAMNAYKGSAVLGVLQVDIRCCYFRPEGDGAGIEARAERASNRAGGDQLTRLPRGGVLPCLQSDGYMNTGPACSDRQFLAFGEIAAQRPLAINVLARGQRVQDQFAMIGNLDGDGY